MLSGQGGGSRDGDGAIRLPLILCYHAVSPTWRSPLSVTPNELAAQMRYLLRRGYKPETLSEAMASPRPAAALAVTFDDAYESVCRHALPVLSSLGIAATLFVPTEIVDRAGQMPEIINIPTDWVGEEDDMRAMSWDDVRRLSAEGWEVGSHTCSHPDLTKVDGGALRSELQRSRERCEEQLQLPCASFAYPFGSYDGDALEAVRQAGYRYAVTLEQHVLEPLAGREAVDLPRDGIYPSTGRLKLTLHGSRLARSLRFSDSYSRFARRWIWPSEEPPAAGAGHGSGGKSPA
jgi:peptidoglycan/xylan/chitin deacetylase (PgdA/CDA1 family)